MRFKEFVVRVGYPADLDITQRDIANALDEFCEVNDCTVEVKETPQITEEQLDGMAIYNACAEGYDDNSEDENIFRIGYEVGFREAERKIDQESQEI